MGQGQGDGCKKQKIERMTEKKKKKLSAVNDIAVGIINSSQAGAEVSPLTAKLVATDRSTPSPVHSRVRLIGSSRRSQTDGTMNPERMIRRLAREGDERLRGGKSSERPCTAMELGKN